MMRICVCVLRTESSVRTWNVGSQGWMGNVGSGDMGKPTTHLSTRHLGRWRCALGCICRTGYAVSVLTPPGQAIRMGGRRSSSEPRLITLFTRSLTPTSPLVGYPELSAKTRGVTERQEKKGKERKNRRPGPGPDQTSQAKSITAITADPLPVPSTGSG